MAPNIQTLAERMSSRALHDMHETVRQAMVGSVDDLQDKRQLRLWAGVIEAELISRNQAVGRLQF